jgi:type I restriction enzyme S subunit
MNLSEKALADGWRASTIGDEYNVNMGQSPPSSSYNRDGIGMPFMQGKSEFGDVYPTIVKYTDSPKKVVEANTVLLSVRAPIGATNISPSEMCIGRGLAGISSKKIPSTFILHQLRNYRSNLESKGTGTTFKAISKTKLFQQEINMPPEHLITDLTRKLDELQSRQEKIQTSLTRLPGLLSDFRESVLNKAMTGSLIGIDFTAKYDVERLGDVCEKPKYGTSTKSDINGDVPVLRMGNLQEGEVDWEKLKFTSDEQEVEKYNLEAGDILFNRTNSPELVGKTSIYRGDRKAIYAGYLIRVRVDRKKLRPEFLNYILNSNYARIWAREVKTDGVSQSNINASKLSDFEFVLPSLDDQDKVIAKAESLLTLRKNMVSRLAVLKTKVKDLPQAVLGRAFRGEL